MVIGGTIDLLQGLTGALASNRQGAQLDEGPRGQGGCEDPVQASALLFARRVGDQREGGREHKGE